MFIVTIHDRNGDKIFSASEQRLGSTAKELTTFAKKNDMTLGYFRKESSGLTGQVFDSNGKMVGHYQLDSRI